MWVPSGENPALVASNAISSNWTTSLSAGTSTTAETSGTVGSANEELRVPASRPSLSTSITLCRPPAGVSTLPREKATWPGMSASPLGDRKSVGEGQRGSGRGELGGRRIIKKTKQRNTPQDSYRRVHRT